MRDPGWNPTPSQSGRRAPLSLPSHRPLSRLARRLCVPLSRLPLLFLSFLLLFPARPLLFIVVVCSHTPSFTSRRSFPPFFPSRSRRINARRLNTRSRYAPCTGCGSARNSGGQLDCSRGDPPSPLPSRSRPAPRRWVRSPAQDSRSGKQECAQVLPSKHPVTPRTQEGRT